MTNQNTPHYSGPKEWHEEILTPETKEILPYLTKIEALKDFHFTSANLAI
jgi:hypothetical protein